MAKNKTDETESSVSDFINAVPDERKRSDSYVLTEMMRTASGCGPRMWGPSIIGFGTYHYKYESGHEGNAPRIAYSPRKNALTLYLGFYPEKKEGLLDRLGKHKASKGCVYIKKLADIDIDVLKEMIFESVQYMKEMYPEN